MNNYYKLNMDEINKLQLIANEKGLELIPDNSVELDYKNAYLDNKYFIKNLEKDTYESYWNVEDDDAEFIFTFQEAYEYIIIS